MMTAVERYKFYKRLDIFSMFIERNVHKYGLGGWFSNLQNTSSFG